MNALSTMRPLLRGVLRLDRSQVAFVTPLRNALGVVAPLALGAATGHLLEGLTVCIGALNVAFSDRSDSYRLRAGQMLLAGFGAALSVFIGGATGTYDVVAVALAAIWALWGGLLVAVGPVATQIGLTSVILLLVFAARPLPPDRAAIEAMLIFGGGALQTALSVAAWPVRRFGPQRDALAAVFRQLAAYTRSSTDAETTLGPASAPPVTGEITNAATTLGAMGNSHSATAEALRALLDEAERIRLEVLALHGARQRRIESGDATLAGRVDTIMTVAGEVLSALADALASGRSPDDSAAPLRRIEAEGEALRKAVQDAANAVERVRVSALLARVDALSGQLRAALEMAAREGQGGEEAAERVEAARPPALRLREPLAILRANLTLRSAACRHAVRLACCVAAADALARGFALPRSYWIPMTAAIILKPDFAATFTRGLARFAGTAAGLGLATLLVYVLFGEIPGRVVLVGVLVFIIRGLGPANYGLSVSAITALVVVLTSFAGSRPETTIVERGLYTLAGGGLALIAYAAWPTWERTQTPVILADLLDAYRRYFAAVMAGYLEPRRRDLTAMANARFAARLARSNAEASIDRLNGEPARRDEDLDRAAGVLANSHRFVHSAMAFEAGLYEDANPPAPAALRVFARDVDTTLRELAEVLRDPAHPLDGLPDLRADQRALADTAPDTKDSKATKDSDDATGSEDTEDGKGVASEADYRLAVMVSEADRVANSVNTMAQVLRRPGA